MSNNCQRAGCGDATTLHLNKTGACLVPGCKCESYVGIADHIAAQFIEGIDPDYKPKQQSCTEFLAADKKARESRFDSKPKQALGSSPLDIQDKCAITISGKHEWTTGFLLNKEIELCSWCGFIKGSHALPIERAYSSITQQPIKIEKPVRFVSISVNGLTQFAIDTVGQLWSRTHKGPWTPEQMPISQNEKLPAFLDSLLEMLSNRETQLDRDERLDIIRRIQDFKKGV